MKKFYPRKQIYETEKADKNGQLDVSETSNEVMTLTSEKVNEETNKIIEETTIESISEDNTMKKKDVQKEMESYQPVASEQLMETVNEPIVYKTTVIEKGAVVTGNLVVLGDLELFGEVKGNIECKAHVTIAGKLVGDLSCEQAHLNLGSIEGDVSIKDLVYVGEKTLIQGNITAKQATILGKVKGDCVLQKGYLHIATTGAIIGDITTGDLMVEKGAIIQGSIKIDKEVDFSEENFAVE